MDYRRSEGLEENFFGIGLTSRKNLCLHPTVSKEKKGKVVDAKCRDMTASWVRAKAGKTKNGQPENENSMDIDANIELCNFYEQLEATESPNPIPNGVYTLEELKAYGKRMSFCPYYLIRRAVSFIN